MPAFKFIETSSAIQIRYAEKAENNERLSCGGALSKAAIQKNEIVADLGSGRGQDVISAARTGKYAYGIDFTHNMIETSIKNLADKGINNASFMFGNFDKIPITDNAVDVIISNCSINHAPDKEKVFSEIHRILKPGGRFVISDIIAEKEIPDEIANNPEAIAGCYGGAITPDRYFDAIQKSGFTAIEILEESRPYEKHGVLIRSVTIRSYKDK